MGATPLPNNVNSTTTGIEDAECTGTAGASADVITEAEAYERFGHLLEDKELRLARQEGRLGYLRRKRKIFYRLSELQTFIDGALEQEYVRATRSPQPQPRPTPAVIERFRAAAPQPSPTASSGADAGLGRLANRIARSEGRA